MKSIRLVVVMALMALSVGCSKEGADKGGGTDVASNSVHIRISTSSESVQTYAADRTPATRATEDGQPAENLVKDLTVLIFTYSADGLGKLEVAQHIPLNPLPDDQIKWAKDSTLIIGNIKNLTTSKSVYVVAGWSSSVPAYSDTDYVVGTTTEKAFKSKMTAITQQIASPTNEVPLMMEGHVTNYNFSTNSFRATVGLARQVAKLRLKIKISQEFMADNTDILWGEVGMGGVKTRMVNIPNRSFVGSRTPSASPSLSDDAQFKLLMYEYNSARPVVAEPQTWRDSLYIYENIVRGKTDAALKNATYILLHMPYSKAGVEYQNNYYKIYINNTTNTTDPYMVERNNIYDIALTVIGFGSSGELVDPEALKSDISVLDWTFSSFSHKFEDSNDLPSNIIIPPWDSAYDPNVDDSGDTGVGDTDGTDDRNDAGNGVIKPWDPNASEGGVGESGGGEDPTEGNDDRTDTGNGAIKPWEPNGDGGGTKI